MKIKIISSLVYYFVRLLNFTYRYEYIGQDNYKKAKTLNPQKTYVFALWHQNLVGAILGHIGLKVGMIVSESDDGELAAVTCQKLGYQPVRGSSRRGGKRALVETIRLVRGGLPVALTVDGPKGPARKVKAGALEIAKVTNSPILPICAYPTSYWQFDKAWDKFKFPKPFSRIIISYGEPVEIEESIDGELFDRKLEELAEVINSAETAAINYLNS